MPCTSPNKVFYIGTNPETGKKKILYTSRFVDYVWRRQGTDKWEKATLPEAHTETHGTRNIETYKHHLEKILPLGSQVVTESDLVPCGQCIGCRLDYSRSWAARMMLESKKYPKDSCWFVTFTYNDEHLPERKEILDPVTGEFKTSPYHSVSKDEHQRLMKRIRKEYGEGIRFFMSAEYGDRSFRPHYHYILFGIQFEDLVPQSHNFRGDILFKSDRLVRTCWTKDGQDIGYALIGRLDFDSCNYVARYTMKKRKMMSKEAYEELGIEPEFCLMSRRPGIGKEYFEENYDTIYETDEIIVPSFNGSFSISPPPYYDTLLERLDPERLASIKECRRIRADDRNRLVAVRRPGLDLEDVYSAQDRQLKNKVIFKKKGEL